MRTSDSIDQLATALSAAQAKMKNATLNKVNPHFRSKYADLAQIRDAVTPALTEQGLAVIHGTDVADGALFVVTRLAHKSGQWVEARFPINQDKPQAMGSAITYARRYNLSAITNIAADEDDDANNANENAPPEPVKAFDHSPIVKEAYKVLDVMLNRIHETGTLEDLQQFWLDNAKTIKDLPAAWKKELTAKKDDIKAALAEKAAA